MRNLLFDASSLYLTLQTLHWWSIELFRWAVFFNHNHLIFSDPFYVKLSWSASSLVCLMDEKLFQSQIPITLQYLFAVYHCLNQICFLVIIWWLYLTSISGVFPVLAVLIQMKKSSQKLVVDRERFGSFITIHLFIDWFFSDKGIGKKNKCIKHDNRNGGLQSSLTAPKKVPSPSKDILALLRGIVSWSSSPSSNFAMPGKRFGIF